MEQLKEQRKEKSAGKGRAKVGAGANDGGEADKENVWSDQDESPVRPNLRKGVVARSPASSASDSPPRPVFLKARPGRYKSRVIYSSSPSPKQAVIGKGRKVSGETKSPLGEKKSGANLPTVIFIDTDDEAPPPPDKPKRRNAKTDRRPAKTCWPLRSSTRAVIDLEAEEDGEPAHPAEHDLLVETAPRPANVGPTTRRSARLAAPPEPAANPPELDAHEIQQVVEAVGVVDEGEAQWACKACTFMVRHSCSFASSCKLFTFCNVDVESCPTH